MKKKIAPSILSADFARLGDEVQAVAAAGADYIHIDVMDGMFVPNITIGPLVVEAVKQVTTLPLDVHLMIEQPERYLEAFVQAGATILSVHPETCRHLQRTLRAIRELGAHPAVALNPATPLSTLDHVLDDVEMILLMTVNPGFGGQEFIPAMLPKIRKLKSLLTRAQKKIPIEVDGGIAISTIKKVAAAGADVFVAGSGIFKTPDYKKTIATMKRLIAA
ncbi:MAG: ribulose-phosphate 3-epimerase [Desulfobacterota bacterium]|nr:ribulose-phosphate 3-epimerase [Thermodesulfobacteriota bacterium]